MFARTLSMISVFAVSATALATAPKYFTNRDYLALLDDDSIRINISKEAQPVINNNFCGRPAIASFVSAEMDRAMNDGVDLPEDLDIVKAEYLSEIGVFNFTDYGGTIFSIPVEVVGRECRAYDATYGEENAD